MRIRGLCKLPDWGGLTGGKLGLVLVSKAMLSKSLIQLSVDGLGCVPSLMFDLRSNYGGGKDDNGDLLQKVPCMHCCTRSVPLTLKKATTNPCLCWRLLDSHGQVWVSLFWGHCAFLLSLGTHKVLFMLS